MRMIAAAWISLVVVLQAGVAPAGTISIETRLELTSSSDNLACRIEVANTGDESAMHLRATSWLGSDRQSVELGKSLEPDQRAEAAFDFRISEFTQGRYHLRVCLDYSDLNGYEMSSVSSAPFTKGRTGEPVVQVVVDDVVLAASGEIKARFKSSSVEKLEIEYQLHVPRELVSEAGVGHLEISPGSEGFVQIPVKNFSGLSGSEYAAFLVVEYESARFHNSVAAPFRIRIDADTVEPLSEGRRTLMRILVLGLLLVAIAAVFWTGRRG